MQLLFDFLPLIAFFGAYMVYDLYVATAAIIVVMAGQIAYQWLRHRKVNKMLLISGALVAVFGGITLALRNPLFIQWKVTVVNWLFAAAFLGSQLLYVMYNYDEQTWVYFKTWGMIGLSLLMAVGQAIWISSRASDRANNSGS